MVATRRMEEICVWGGLEGIAAHPDQLPTQLGEKQRSKKDFPRKGVTDPTVIFVEEET